MIWYSMVELDLCLGLIIIILSGLISLRGFKNINLADIHFACQCWPLLAVAIILSEAYNQNYSNIDSNLKSSGLIDLLVSHNFDILLALITVVVLRSFKSFESLLLIIIAYVAQAFMLHCCDLVSFYICLEAQNFCFLVLCGLQPDKRSNGFSVEASLKFLLLSAFSSGVLLFCFATLYLHTGITSLFLKSACFISDNGLSGTNHQLESFIILLALLFKLGCAPVHLWVVYIYQSIKRPLLIFISTAPKLSLFTFWSSAWQLIWTDYTLSVFIVYTLILGSLGAYGYASQPAVRALLAYSTISEIGFILLAAETAGFHTLFQHLSIYILTQLLIWNLSDKRLLSLSAVSLAGIPPLAGFFGKAWIFFHVVNIHIVALLIIAVVCSVLAIVYYLRILRMFWYLPTGQSLNTLMFQTTGYRALGVTQNSLHSNACFSGVYSSAFDRQIGLAATCFIGLIVLPIFFIKPFVI